MVVVLSMIQPTLLLAGGTALGASLAPRVGLISHVATRAESGSPIWPHLQSEAPLALAAGLALGLVTVPLDLLFEPYLGPAWAEAMKETAEFEGPGALISGLLYGGITEELMLRWGLLSFLVWAGWRLLQRRRGTPGPGVMWGAVILAALAFGLGHLPAVAAFAPLSPVLIMRTMVLNALGGVLFGWLFWRRSLEAAMLGHAAANLGSTLIFWSGLLTP
ncbi:MAG: CPBP family intramembrane metalloprotease [Gemmatimonadota bacterium]|nr:CPBP family intramembrane metalloprotease [Gemmatimonadota bacterium]